MQLLQRGEKINEKQMRKIPLLKLIQGNKKYIEMCTQIIDEIDKQEPKDRLEYATALLVIISAMNGSIQGWLKWCNIKSMDNLKFEEFKDIYPKMRKIAKEWIKIDKEITEAKMKELEKILKEMDDDEGTTPTKKTRKSSSQLYVA